MCYLLVIVTCNVLSKETALCQNSTRIMQAITMNMNGTRLLLNFYFNGSLILHGAIIIIIIAY